MPVVQPWKPQKYSKPSLPEATGTEATEAAYVVPITPANGGVGTGSTRPISSAPAAHHASARSWAYIHTASTPAAPCGLSFADEYRSPRLPKLYPGQVRHW